MNQNETVKIILGSLKRADDMVMALDFIKAAKLHDAHTKLLMKLIDHEFYQMEEEHENDN